MKLLKRWENGCESAGKRRWMAHNVLGWRMTKQCKSADRDQRNWVITDSASPRYLRCKPDAYQSPTARFMAYCRDTRLEQVINNNNQKIYISAFAFIPTHTASGPYSIPHCLLITPIQIKNHHLPLHFSHLSLTGPLSLCPTASSVRVVRLNPCISRSCSATSQSPLTHLRNSDLSAHARPLSLSKPLIGSTPLHRRAAWRPCACCARRHICNPFPRCVYMLDLLCSKLVPGVGGVDIVSTSRYLSTLASNQAM